MLKKLNQMFFHYLSTLTLFALILTIITHHQYSVSVIFQAVTHISFKKRITIVFRAKGNLSAPHHLTRFLNIETWKHSPTVLIPIFHAGKDILYVPTIIQFVHVAAVGGIEPQAFALPAQRPPNNVRYALQRHGSGRSVHGDAPKGCQEAYPPSSSQRH